MAATVITPAQLAGVKLAALAFELPAATTTTVLRLCATLIAFCDVKSQAPLPPSDRLITRAGVGLTGSPGTEPPGPHDAVGDVRGEAAAFAEHAHRQHL